MEFWDGFKLSMHTNKVDRPVNSFRRALMYKSKRKTLTKLDIPNIYYSHKRYLLLIQSSIYDRFNGETFISLVQILSI